jgi:hypothetical protein
METVMAIEKETLMETDRAGKKMFKTGTGEDDVIQPHPQGASYHPYRRQYE